jgi:hypothetical protein
MSEMSGVARGSVINGLSTTIEGAERIEKSNFYNLNLTLSRSLPMKVLLRLDLEFATSTTTINQVTDTGLILKMRNQSQTCYSKKMSIETAVVLAVIFLRCFLS